MWLQSWTGRHAEVSLGCFKTPLHASLCVEALKEVFSKYGMPEVMNTNQRKQYTSTDWIPTLTKAEIKISMNGGGRYLDNNFIEPLWWSLKKEVIYS